MFFHVWAVRQVEVFIQGWLARFRTPHKPPLCESEERKKTTTLLTLRKHLGYALLT